MKTLHIADVHEELATLRWILEQYESTVDWTVFHGDFMDSYAYQGDPRAGVMMFRWLRDAVNEPRRSFLFGNHDIQYAFDVCGLYCSGFNETKKIMGLEIDHNQNFWKQFKLFEYINGFLCSHAGINSTMLHPVKGFDIDYLREQEQKCFQDLTLNIMNPMVGAGRARGGPFPNGGITWQDFDKEFVSIPEVKQLFGHTPGQDVRLRDNSYCFDCYDERTPLQKICIISDEVPEFISVKHINNNFPWESPASRYRRPQNPPINYNR